MIGSLTETSLIALRLGIALEQMSWPQGNEAYDVLRAETQNLIGDLGVDSVVIPQTHAEFVANVGAVTSPITAYFSTDRGRILGDTAALPLFFLNSFALRFALHAGLGNPDAELLEFIEDCLEDLGLDRDLSRLLEREAGWITLLSDQEEPTIRQVDVIKAGGSFVLRVMEEFGRSEEGLGGLQDAISALRADVADFREEFRATSVRFEQLITQGNAEVVAALAETKAALVEEAGVDSDTAAELTEGDPGRFWERLVRWFGGASARDAGEAALWAALDFVPGGVGVKLGIKVAGAIRAALKGSK